MKKQPPPRILSPCTWNILNSTSVQNIQAQVVWFLPSAALNGDKYCRHFLHSYVHLSVCLSVCPEQRYLFNSFRISGISLKFVWCTETWSRLLFKMTMLGQFHGTLKFSMIALGPVQENMTHINYEMWGNHDYSQKCHGTKQITIWNGIAQPMFTFSDLSWPRVLSFSKCLVEMYQDAAV